MHAAETACLVVDARYARPLSGFRAARPACVTLAGNALPAIMITGHGDVCHGRRGDAGWRWISPRSRSGSSGSPASIAHCDWRRARPSVGVAAQPRQCALPGLTWREHEVMEHVVAGHAITRRLPRRLGIALGAAPETHRGNVMKQNGCRLSIRS